MPYSNISELPKEVRALPRNLQEQWMSVFNSAFAESNDEGAAIAQAWGVVNERKRTKSMYVEFSTKAQDGKLLLAGIGTTERIDLDKEIVDKESLINSLDDYMQDPVVFDMHIQGAKVGKVLMMNYFEGKELEEFCTNNNLPMPSTKSGLGVIAEIEDVRAKTDIVRGLKRGFSIGFECIKRIGNLIVTKLREISIVDVPCNQDCYFSVLKMYGGSGIIEEKEDVPAAVPQEVSIKDKKKLKEIFKMDTKMIAKMIQMGIDPNDATEHLKQYAKMLVEKDEAEERAKTDAEFAKKYEAEKAEITKEKEELIKKYEERIEKLEKAAKAMHEEEIAAAKDSPITQGTVPEKAFKTFDNEEILKKGKATGEYDLSGFKFGMLPGQQYRDYALLKCKCFAQEILKKFNEGHKTIDMGDIKAKFRVKAALDTTTTSTGAYVLDVSFNQFIVDEPFKDNPLLMFLPRRPVSTKTFEVRRCTAYGAARMTGESTAYSAARGTYEKETVTIKILRYDGAVTKFMTEVDNIDMLAQEIYNGKQAHDQLLETMIINGPGEIVTTALTTETGALSFKGLAKYAEQLVNKSETVLTQSLLYTDLEGAYRSKARMRPDLYLFDSLLIAKVKDVTDGKAAIDSNIIDASISVPTMGNVPIAESWALNDDVTAAPSFALTKGSGTINDQVFVSVAAITLDGTTVKATEANETCSAAESLIITITNRTDDIGYIVYVGSATGETYEFKRFEKASGATTVLTISATPTYTTSSNALKGRKDTDDRLFMVISNSPIKGARLAVNKENEFEMLGFNGIEKQFVLSSNVALEVLDGKTIMHGVIAKA